MKLTILHTFLALLLVSYGPEVFAGKLYKWVDANGNISYQDQPPPKNGKILSEKEVATSGDEPVQDSDGLPQVTVYSVDDCELCDRLVSVLRANKVPHIELPLEDDRGAQAKILEKASSIIAPTIFIGEDIIQGGNEENLRAELRSAGFDVETPSGVTSENRLTIDDADDSTSNQ